VQGKLVVEPAVLEQLVALERHRDAGRFGEELGDTSAFALGDVT